MNTKNRFSRTRTVFSGPTLAGFAALTLLLFFVSCGNSGSGTSGTDGKDSTAQGNDTTEQEIEYEMQDAAAECADLAPGKFCVNGLDFIQLGDSLTWNENIRPTLPGVTMKDTVLEDVQMGESGPDTTSWFTKMMLHPDGRIYLEADFETGHLLNRIRIETKDYVHPSGLHVGSTVQEIGAAYAQPFINPFPAYGVMEIVILYNSGQKLVLQVPLPEVYDTKKEGWLLSDLPQSAAVVRIILM